jgi:hypothetical protein
MACDMAGDEKSIVLSTGEVIGDCSPSMALGKRGLFVRRGECGGAGCMARAGDCCLLDKTLGRIRLFLFRSRELATLFSPISDAGESARRGPDITEDRMLVSLSAPASLSKCIEWRLFWLTMLMAPTWDRGVWQPRGLLDRVESATEDSRRPS